MSGHVAFVGAGPGAPDLVRVAEPLRRRRQARALAPRGEVAR